MASLMEYQGYHGKIEYSTEERKFFGKVVDIDGTIVFEGSSVSELEYSFRNAVDRYLDWCREIGKKPVREYKGSFNVRISPELHRDAALTAAENNSTLNQFVAQAIKEKLQRTF